MTLDGAYALLGVLLICTLFAFYLSEVAIKSEDEHDMKTGKWIRGMIFPVSGLLSTFIIVATLY